MLPKALLSVMHCRFCFLTHRNLMLQLLLHDELDQIALIGELKSELS